MTTSEQLYQAFSTGLGLPLADVSDDLTYNTIPEWDSTAHMIVVAELENQFNIMLDTDDIIDMSSVKAAKSILAKYDIEF